MSEPPVQARAKHPPKVLDRAVGPILLGLFLLECLVVGSVGLLFQMMSDGCSSYRPCNESLISAGVGVASFGQLVPAALGARWFLNRWRARRTVWFVPLLMAIVPVLLFSLGMVIAGAGLP